MRTCIPTSDPEPTLSSKPESVFGNAKTYMLIGADLDDIVYLKNDKSDNKHIADELMKYNVKSIISNELCDHCMSDLRSNSMDIWKGYDHSTVREAYQNYTIGGDFIRQSSDSVDCEHSNFYSS